MLLAEIVNAYEAAGELLDKEAPAALSFKIADLVLALENKRKAFQLVIDKIPKDESGQPDKKHLLELMAQEVEITMPRITRSELMKGFQTISPRSVMALMPMLEVEDDG